MSNKTEKEIMLTYTVKEVAELMGVCENSARILVNRKDFPKVRIGRRIIIPKAAFHDWLNSKAFNVSC